MPALTSPTQFEVRGVPTDLSFQMDIGVRLLAAALLGGAVGLEREIHGHQAGMRTHMLVALGSAVFTVLSIYGFSSSACASSILSPESRRCCSTIA